MGTILLEDWTAEERGVQYNRNKGYNATIGNDHRCVKIKALE
jgi:hypothetical protein